jgi:MtN3 and saliva related transmembrane protein
MTMDLTTITGIAASVFAAVSPLPQVVKLVREKTSEGISFWMFSTLLAGLALWIAYGVLRKDWILIASNGFSFVMNTLIMVLGLIYKKS